MDFRSDNTTGVAPEIMAALAAVNTGYQSSYGVDEYTVQVQKRVAEIFEHDVIIYLVATGTAANALALSSMVGMGGIVYCHEQAHINTDESGAPSYFSPCLLHTIKGQQAKIAVQDIERHVQHVQELRPHASMSRGISISQSTEYGTAYTLDELAEINKIAKKYNLHLHMDGARFTNGLVAIGCSPAEMTWKSGVDVLSFGATKNGAMLAEMIVFFNKELAKDFDYSIKRAGQLISKERFIAAQFLAFFENDLWLRNARHANAMAQELFRCFEQAHIKVLYKPVCNEIFVAISPDLAQWLQAQGAKFFHWHNDVYRFVTSFVTTREEIQSFGKVLFQATTNL